MMKSVVSALLAVGFGFSSSAYAGVAICDYCNLGQKRMKARELGVRDHYLWDFNLRTAYHMNVSVNGGGRPPSPMSMPAADYVRPTSDSQMTASAGAQLILKEVALI